MDPSIVGVRLSDIPSGNDLVRFAVLLTTLLVAARVLGWTFAHLGQPPIIGELLAGIFLGPSVLGALSPEVYHLLLAPENGEVRRALAGFSSLAVVLIMAVAGLEIDLGKARRLGRPVASAAAGGLLVPFAVGVGLGCVLARVPGMSGVPDAPSLFVLFVATMLSISAVPAIVKILFDLNLIRTGVGATILSAAVFIDIVAWILIAYASGLANGYTNLRSFGVLAALVALFLVLALLLGHRAACCLTNFIRRTGLRWWAAAGFLICAFSLAEFTHFLGVHAVLGAFVGGLIFTKTLGPEVVELRSLQTTVMKFIGPMFFAAFGLKVNLSLLLEPAFLLILMIVMLAACAAKLIGGTLGAYVGGLPFWEAAAVGSGLNARGSVEVIVAALALSLGVITEQLYSIVVLMAVATSMMTPTLLKWTLTRGKQASRTEWAFITRVQDGNVGNLPSEVTVASWSKVKYLKGKVSKYG